VQHALLTLHSPLENTPHKAGVIGDYLVRAMIALLNVAAQRNSPANTDVAEGFPLLWGDGVSPALQKLLSMLTEDIGHLEPMLVHLLLPSPSVVRISRSSRLSRGLGVAWSFCSET
jgi:hypothetical protein